MHMRQRVIYTVFFMDRRMAHSCGQPYGMRSQDLAVTEPAGLRDSVSGHAGSCSVPC
jgi:hypothetical protein